MAFAIPAAVLVGVSSIAFMTSSTAIVQVRAAPEFRGRVLAIQSMVFLGSTPIGGPTIGWIADVAGPRIAIVVGAARLRRSRDLRSARCTSAAVASGRRRTPERTRMRRSSPGRRADRGATITRATRKRWRALARVAVAERDRGLRLADLDPVIHPPKRLAIAAILANATSADFSFLREQRADRAGVGRPS